MSGRRMQATCRRGWKIGRKMNKVRWGHAFRPSARPKRPLDKAGPGATCRVRMGARASARSIATRFPSTRRFYMIDRLRAAAALLLVVAGSCGDATLPDDVGVFRFQYSARYPAPLPRGDGSAPIRPMPWAR
jgi:hypothetical protein